MNEQLVFGVMADCQYADADSVIVQVPEMHLIYDNRFRLSQDKLREAVDVFNSHELDFVIHLGDFIDRKLDDFDTVAKITDELTVPLLHVLGNHDFMGSEGKTDEVEAKFGLKTPYYSQVIKGYRLIVLDTNELGVIKYREGTAQWQKGRQKLEDLKQKNALQAYDWNGGVGDEQLQWLDAELVQATNEGQKVILFSHHPVFPPNGLNALDDTKILGLIDTYSDVVVAYINGHNHLGAYGERQGKPYITMPGILQGETNAFGIATVSDKTLAINGYGRVQDMLIERR